MVTPLASGNTAITQTPHMRNATPLNMTFALTNDGTPQQSASHLQVPALSQQNEQHQSPAATNGDCTQLSTAQFNNSMMAFMQQMQTQMEQVQSNMTHLAANVNGKYRAMQQGIADTIESTITARLADQEVRFSQQFEQLSGAAGLESLFAPPTADNRQPSVTAQSTGMQQPQVDMQLNNSATALDTAITGTHGQSTAAVLSPLTEAIQRHTAMHPPPFSIRQPAPSATATTQSVCTLTSAHATINNSASTAAVSSISTLPPNPQVLESASHQQLLQQQILQQQQQQRLLLQQLRAQAVASSANLIFDANQQQPTAPVNSLLAYNYLNQSLPVMNQSLLNCTSQPAQAQTLTTGSVHYPFSTAGTQPATAMQNQQPFPSMTQVPSSNNNKVIGALAPQQSAQSPNSLVPDSTSSTAPFGEDAHILQELIEQHKRKSGVQHMNSRAMTALLASQATTQLRDADIISSKTLQPYEFGGTASFPTWLNRFEIFLAIKNICSNDAKVLALQQFLGEKAYSFFLSLPDQTKGDAGCPIYSKHTEGHPVDPCLLIETATQ
jgi:hypothetical protein